MSCPCRKYSRVNKPTVQKKLYVYTGCCGSYNKDYLDACLKMLSRFFKIIIADLPCCGMNTWYLNPNLTIARLANLNKIIIDHIPIVSLCSSCTLSLGFVFALHYSEKFGLLKDLLSICTQYYMPNIVRALNAKRTLLVVGMHNLYTFGIEYYKFQQSKLRAFIPTISIFELNTTLTTEMYYKEPYNSQYIETLKRISRQYDLVVTTAINIANELDFTVYLPTLLSA